MGAPPARRAGVRRRHEAADEDQFGAEAPTPVAQPPLAVQGWSIQSAQAGRHVLPEPMAHPRTRSPLATLRAGGTGARGWGTREGALTARLKSCPDESCCGVARCCSPPARPAYGGNILRGAGRPTAPALLYLLLTHQLDLNFAPERMRNANEGGDREVPRFVLNRRDLRRAHIGHGSQLCLTESFFLAELGNLNPQLEILEFPLHKIPEPLIFHLLFVETIPTSSHFYLPSRRLL